MKHRMSRMLGVVVLVTVTACGGGVQDEGLQADQDPPAGDDPLEEAPPETDGGWAAIVEAAEEEGELTFYSTSSPSINERLQAAFAEAHPEIDLEVIRIFSTESEPALEAERETGARGADVVSGVNYAWMWEKAAEGWFAPLVGPELTDSDSAWVGTEYLVGGDRLANPVGLVVVSWNTSLLQDGIEGYGDLLDPRLGDGAIGITTPEFPIMADYWAFIDEHHHEGFVEEMAQQEPTIFDSAVPLLEALVAGEIAVGAFTTVTDVLDAQETGAPVEFVLVDPSWTAQNVFFAVEWAANPNAAQVFMNFAASAEGQLAAGIHGCTPLEEIRDQTACGQAEIVLSNVDRLTDAEWHEAFYDDWRELYGR